MKTIQIKIEEEDYEELKILIECVTDGKVTPNQVLQQFIYDLTWSERSGGSDERDLARDWIWRSKYNF